MAGDRDSDVPTRRGSRFHEHFVPDHDSELVRRYQAAGVIILGKTKTPEYGLMPATGPVLFGPSRNPWDLSRSPDGSNGRYPSGCEVQAIPERTMIDE
jgi:amidase